MSLRSRLSRRGFFGVSAALPLGLKEAAEKMQLRLSPGTMLPSPGGPGIIGDYDPNPDYVEATKEALALFDTTDAVQERRDRVSYEARWIDADLAACRSVSPSALYLIQKDRMEARAHVRDRQALERRLARLLKKKIGL